MGKFFFLTSCSLMLQIISIYKVTDFAPLFCYCDHGRATSRIDLCKVTRMVSVHLSDTKIMTGNSQISLPVQIQRSCSWLRNLHNYFLRASFTDWIIYQPVKRDSQLMSQQVLRLLGTPVRKIPPENIAVVYLIKRAVYIIIGFPEAVFTKIWIK